MDTFPIPGETRNGSSFRKTFGGKGANICVAAVKLGLNRPSFLTSVSFLSSALLVNNSRIYILKTYFLHALYSTKLHTFLVLSMTRYKISCRPHKRVSHQNLIILTSKDMRITAMVDALFLEEAVNVINGEWFVEHYFG